jgi:hypothetical protein
MALGAFGTTVAAFGTGATTLTASAPLELSSDPNWRRLRLEPLEPLVLPAFEPRETLKFVSEPHWGWLRLE